LADFRLKEPRLKLSKTSWLLIVIGVFIIALASLGVVRSQQIHQQNQLTEELTLAQSKLKKFQLDQLSRREEELERELSQIKSQLEAAKAILSQPNGSIVIAEKLFEIARDYDVVVTEISSPNLTTEELAGIVCTALPLTVRAEGELASLIGFITRLNNELTTGIVRSVEIAIPEMTGRSSADIQLIVYRYQGE
jgi:cell division protein FtsB